MAPTLRLTAQQQRKALELAEVLASFAAQLNDAYPLPPDANHRTLEALAQGLLVALQPKKMVKPKRA